MFYKLSQQTTQLTHYLLKPLVSYWTAIHLSYKQGWQSNYTKVRDNGVKEWSVDGLQESYETIGGQSDETLLSAIECLPRMRSKAKSTNWWPIRKWLYSWKEIHNNPGVASVMPSSRCFVCMALITTLTTSCHPKSSGKASKSTLRGPPYLRCSWMASLWADVIYFWRNTKTANSSMSSRRLASNRRFWRASYPKTVQTSETSICQLIFNYFHFI